MIRTLDGSGRGSAALARLPGVRLLQRVHELVLAHRGTAGDVEALGEVVQVGLAGVGVDATRCAATPTALLGGLVAGALLVLGLPVVADLLEPALDRREGGAVGALAL